MIPKDCKHPAEVNFAIAEVSRRIPPEGVAQRVDGIGLPCAGSRPRGRAREEISPIAPVGKARGTSQARVAR